MTDREWSCSQVAGCQRIHETGSLWDLVGRHPDRRKPAQNQKRGREVFFSRSFVNSSALKPLGRSCWFRMICKYGPVSSNDFSYDFVATSLQA